MRNDPGFDPFFNDAPSRDRAAPQRMLFDGWSYQPLATERDDRASTAATARVAQERLIPPA